MNILRKVSERDVTAVCTAFSLAAVNVNTASPAELEALPGIAHVADYTGEAVMQSLIAQIRCRPNIRVCERQMALVVQTESGAACGLTVLDCRTQETYRIRACHTVLAGGGLGQIYAATTTPPECTGDAIAMAIRAGCAVENLEFIQ